MGFCDRVFACTIAYVQALVAFIVMEELARSGELSPQRWLDIIAALIGVCFALVGALSIVFGWHQYMKAYQWGILLIWVYTGARVAMNMPGRDFPTRLLTWNAIAADVYFLYRVLSQADRVRKDIIQTKIQAIGSRLVAEGAV